MIRNITIAIIVLCAASVHGFDLLDGQSGVLIDQANPGAVEIQSLPSVRRPAGSWQFESGWERLYNLAELDRIFVAGAWRHRSFGLAAGLGQLGRSDLYAERTVRSSLTYWRGRLGFGLIWSYRYLDFAGNFPALDAAAWGGSITLDMQSLLISGSVHNIGRPSFISGSPPQEPVYRLQVQAIREHRFSLLGGLLFENGQHLRWSIGQIIELADRSDLLWHVSSDPWVYGGGLRIGWQATTFRYSVVYHPVLGLTHTVSIGLGSQRRPDDSS